MLFWVNEGNLNLTDKHILVDWLLCFEANNSFSFYLLLTSKEFSIAHKTFIWIAMSASPRLIYTFETFAPSIVNDFPILSCRPPTIGSAPLEQTRLVFAIFFSLVLKPYQPHTLTFSGSLSQDTRHCAEAFKFNKATKAFSSG